MSSHGRVLALLQKPWPPGMVIEAIGAGPKSDDVGDAP